ncbi:MAG: DEAD/DEAH box helicase [Bacteroides sp.]|nr:DEAD/DEAH box helicase [Bacteroides sp.]
MKLYDYQEDLIERVRAAWRRGKRKPCIVLPCGGGKSVICADMAKRTTDNGRNVLFLVHREELCRQIESTFTDYGVNTELCTVGMVQTVTRHIERINKPSLIITDENHHCLASSYRYIYEAFPESCFVGVTATPVRLNGGGLGEINDCLIIGPSVKQLIENEKLAPYDYYAPKVADLSGIRSRNGDYAAEDIEAALNKPHIYGDVIKYYKRLKGGKAVCYCATVKHSQDMAEAFRKHGISAYHIDGKTPTNERSCIIQGFREGKIRVLCNVDLISEGFDVPDCSTSILLRPTKSLTLYIQQAMRCMRYQPGKKALIIDHVGNVHRHGLPDTEREWTLDSKPPKADKRNTVSVRQCTECFFTHKPAPACPKCGHIYELTQREIKEKQEAELKKIVEGYTAPTECRNLKELHIYAKERNYKAGWAYYQAKKMGF